MDDLMEEDIDIIMKIIVVGDGRIGKPFAYITSLPFNSANLYT